MDFGTVTYDTGFGGIDWSNVGGVPYDAGPGTASSGAGLNDFVSALGSLINTGLGAWGRAEEINWRSDVGYWGQSVPQTYYPPNQRSDTSVILWAVLLLAGVVVLAKD